MPYVSPTMIELSAHGEIIFDITEYDVGAYLVRTLYPSMALLPRETMPDNPSRYPWRKA